MKSTSRSRCANCRRFGQVCFYQRQASSSSYCLWLSLRHWVSLVRLRRGQAKWHVGYYLRRICIMELGLVTTICGATTQLEEKYTVNGRVVSPAWINIFFIF